MRLRYRRLVPLLLAAAPGVIAAGALAAGAPPPAPSWQVAQEASSLVWCYDAARSLVSRKRAWECTGKVVDDDEARRIQSSRARIIQRKLQPGAPLFPGKRLAGTGTGFFVSAKGHALTNDHVAGQCAAVSVTPAGGAPIAASVIATDRPHDLALLQAPVAPQEVAAFRAPLRLQPAEPVMVVGYPLLQLVAIRPVFVTGQVFGEGHATLSDRFPLRIDIRHGNSGSPVMDGSGRVIGIISAKADTPKIYAATGRVVRDLGVAIGEAAILDLMRNNGVAPTTANAGPALDEKALFAHGTTLVAQIGCWR